MKNKENVRYSRSFSYAPRSFQVCFGSYLRPRCASVGFVYRHIITVHYIKYTNDNFNLLLIFIFTILIYVLSIVQTVPCAFFASALVDYFVIARSFNPLWRITLLLFLLSTINYKLSTKKVCTTSSAGGF